MLCSFGLLQYPPSEKRLVWYLHGVLNSICYRSHFWLKAHVGLLMLLAPLTLVGHRSTATAPSPGFEPAVIRLREAPYPLGQRAQQEGFVKEKACPASPLFCRASTLINPPCWRPYLVEYTGSLLTSEVKLPRAWLVLGWGTAWEHLQVLSALLHEAS